MKCSQEGLELIKKFEGCKLKSYKCPAGVWTIGYGHTEDIKEGDIVSPEEANKLLRADVFKFEEYVTDNVIVNLTQNQFDLGVGNLRNSTMLKKLNNADYTSVPFEMKRWNKAGGKTLDGLVRRRQAESLLFESKEWHKI